MPVWAAAASLVVGSVCFAGKTAFLCVCAADLYNCGKVCLSLLGTWQGGQGEGWNPEVSSAFQVGQRTHAQL